MAVPSPFAPRSKTSAVESIGKQKAQRTSAALETQLATLYATLANGSDLNPLIDVIEILRDRLLVQFDEKHANSLRKGVQFLVRSLQTLLADDRIPVQNVGDDGFLVVTSLVNSAQSASRSQEAVASWLQVRWNEAILLLCQLLGVADEETALFALRSLMLLQRDASSSLTRSLANSTAKAQKHASTASAAAAVRGQWSRSPWLALMAAMAAGPPKYSSKVERSARFPAASDALVVDFVESYLQRFDDVRHAFCKYVSDALQRKDAASVELHRRTRLNVIHFMLGLTAIPTKEEHINTFLVASFTISERKKASKKASRSNTTKGGDDSASDAEDDLDDWFSDSDEDFRQAASVRQQRSAEGIGNVALAAIKSNTNRRRLKRHPPFHDAVRSLAAQRAAYSRAWLSLLLPTRLDDEKPVGGELTTSTTHEALVRMHTQILPHLSKPNLLHDFLVDALDAGGATALLALNTLFTLMTRHNLNYPAFYTRLYALLQSDPPFLHVRYRSRFLRLLDVFLSSTHLPSALIASFAKRLSRAALRAPPAAIVVVLPFVWNLCKRHKPCLALIHREFSNDRFDQGPIGIVDPYDASESDPLKTNAMESSLWELSALGTALCASQQITGGVGDGQTHYLASVSSLSRILAEPFTKERYGLEDFLDLTYGTILDTETAKTLKRKEGKRIVEPAVAHKLPRIQGKMISVFGHCSFVQHDEEQRKGTRLVEGEGESDEGEVDGEVIAGEEEDREDVELQEARRAMEEVCSANQHVPMCSRLFAC